MSSLLRRLETVHVPGAGSSGLRARWSYSWTPELEAFCRQLPAHHVLSSELFSRLMSASEHRTAAVAVYEGGRPVGLAGLRAETGSTWSPITGGWLDGCEPCWSAPEDVVRCQMAVGAYVRHIFARGVVEAGGAVRRVNPMFEFKLDTGKSEEFWRSSGHWRKVQKARNRSESDGTLVSIDQPGAASWVVTNWAGKWGRDSDLEPFVKEGVAYFLEKGQAHCFVLEDHGARVAGDVFLVNGDSLESICNYRRDGVEDTIVLDRAVQWAQEQGIRWFNLGPGQAESYKRKWAPPQTPITEIDVAPWHVFALLNAKHMATRMVRRG